MGPSIRAGSVAQTPESRLPRRLTSPNSLNASMWHGQTLHMKYNRAASTSSLSPPRPLHHTHTRSPFSFPLPILLFRPHMHPPTSPLLSPLRHHQYRHHPHPPPLLPSVRSFGGFWPLVSGARWARDLRGWMFGTGIAGVWPSVVFSDTAVGLHCTADNSCPRHLCWLRPAVNLATTRPWFVMRCFESGKTTDTDMPQQQG